MEANFMEESLRSHHFSVGDIENSLFHKIVYSHLSGPCYSLLMFNLRLPLYICPINSKIHSTLHWWLKWDSNPRPRRDWKLRNARETDSILKIKMIILTCINFLPIETDLQNKLIKMIDHMYKNHFNSHAFSPADICNLVPLILRLYSKHKFANLRELIPGLDFRLFSFIALELTYQLSHIN